MIFLCFPYNIVTVNDTILSFQAKVKSIAKRMVGTEISLVFIKHMQVKK